MSGWNNRVSCLSNFFCIFRISLKKIVYISYSNVSLYVYSATQSVITAKCCFIIRFSTVARN